MNLHTDTIIAPATPQGQSALAVIRLSGTNAISITDQIFKGDSLTNAATHTVHYGWIVDGDTELDEVMVSVFRAPRTFTAEDSTEISCHGSPHIVQSIINVAIKNGAKTAYPGEFTLRAFLNGRIDLSQAEAVADLIHSSSSKSASIALNQLKGHFSHMLKDLRQELIDFAALIELELDFSEEDVEFAHRGRLKDLIHKIIKVINPMMDSFRWGNSIKEGIPVAIIGAPNAGKSTLLNTILDEEKALVSDIAGTTRDFIEDTLVIDGITFRFIDTAGIRHTTDVLEGMGIERSRQKLREAEIIFFLSDVNKSADDTISDFEALGITENQKAVILLNKADTLSAAISESKAQQIEAAAKIKTLIITAKYRHTLSPLMDYLRTYIAQQPSSDGTIISNSRHYEALQNTKLCLEKVLTGMDSGLTSDFVAMDLREALFHLGTIIGEVTTDDLLESIFSKFCIGK
jgi:tRNA modification GTPase